LRRKLAFDMMICGKRKSGELESRPMKKQVSIRGHLQILSAALLWSTAGILVKLLPWGSLSICSLRGLLGAASLIVLRRIQHASGKGYIPFRMTKYNIASGLAMFMTSTLFMAANKLTTAANAIVLQYIAPILILIYTAVSEKRRPTLTEILLAGTVFLGCVLAFSDKLTGSGTLGNILALVSGFTFAAMILINRYEKVRPEDGQIIGCSMSFLLFMPLLFTDKSLIFTPKSIGAMLILGLFQYALANLLFAFGIKKTEPTAASILLTMEPIMSPVWVYLLLGEAPGLQALLGFVLVIAAVTFQSLLPLLRQRYRPGDVKSHAAQE
jgi:drug/metabolite transporter (DMT)-like permease